jgi:hypothetical protein
MITVIYIWRIKSGAMPLLRALRHQTADRRELRSDPAIGFYKLLGTGSGESFTPGDADLRSWALIITIDERELDRFDSSENIESWRKIALSEKRMIAQPISTHGLWSGTNPFERCELMPASEWGGKVLALTRARLVAKHALRFWRAVPPVNQTLHQSPGLELAIGIGEAPIGVQGTLSLWESAQAMKAFAYGSATHREVIAQTSEIGWYSEELFGRFAVLELRQEMRE